MIQTWATYELVKVVYIYGLNPEPNDSIEIFAPDIDTYIHYLRFREEDLEDKTTSETLFSSIVNINIIARYLITIQ
jgi:hypothetical protein